MSVVFFDVDGSTLATWPNELISINVGDKVALKAGYFEISKITHHFGETKCWTAATVRKVVELYLMGCKVDYGTCAICNGTGKAPKLAYKFFVDGKERESAKEFLTGEQLLEYEEVEKLFHVMGKTWRLVDPYDVFRLSIELPQFWREKPRICEGCGEQIPKGCKSCNNSCGGT